MTAVKMIGFGMGEELPAGHTQPLLTDGSKDRIYILKRVNFIGRVIKIGINILVLFLVVATY